MFRLRLDDSFNFNVSARSFATAFSFPTNLQLLSMQRQPRTASAAEYFDFTNQQHSSCPCFPIGPAVAQQ
jgi:hypothetical protein